jgi:hypothetical protein
MPSCKIPQNRIMFGKCRDYAAILMNDEKIQVGVSSK